MKQKMSNHLNLQPIHNRRFIIIEVLILIS